MSSAEPTHRRPKLVEDALRDKTPIYYFGLGSNMSRSHIENRSFDGEKIQVRSMEPAVVHNYRLAFNLPAFLPLEPAMGSLENISFDKNEPERGTPTLPLYPYEKPECHGALIQLSSDDYEKVMQSEGVSGNHFPVRNYAETVVTGVPYDKSKSPVQAVVLRVYPHVRLPRDVAPSARYMKILRDGAAELGLASCYQLFLQTHPVQTTPLWLQIVALPNLLLTMSFYLAGSSSPWSKRLTRFQYNLMYQVYACPTSPAPRRWLSHILHGLFLLPGSVLGLGLLGYRFVTNTRHPVPVEMFLSKMKQQMMSQAKSSSGDSSMNKAAS